MGGRKGDIRKSARKDYKVLTAAEYKKLRDKGYRKAEAAEAAGKVLTADEYKKLRDKGYRRAEAASKIQGMVRGSRSRKPQWH